MRINVQHFNLRSVDRLDAWVERQILALGAVRQIDEANIRLARHANVSPAYEVTAHLVTPGPDLFADARDHTVRAAFAKVVEQLRVTMASRSANRLKTVASKLSTPAAKSRLIRSRISP